MLTIPASSTSAIPAGGYRAVCDGVAFLGLHTDEFPGQEPKQVYKIGVRFFMVRGGETYSRWEKMNLSDHEKSTLAKVVTGLTGKPIPANFDISKLVGMGGRLTFVEKPASNGKTYINLASASPLDPDDKPVVSPNDPLVFDFDKPLAEVHPDLPNWLANVVRDSITWSGPDAAARRNGNTEKGRTFTQSLL